MSLFERPRLEAIYSRCGNCLKGEYAIGASTAGPRQWAMIAYPFRSLMYYMGGASAECLNGVTITIPNAGECMVFHGTFVAELRRRRVFRAAAFYIVGAWVALQVVGEALPALKVPDEAIRFVWLIAIFGFPIAVLLSWRYEFGDGALVRTPPAEALWRTP